MTGGRPGAPDTPNVRVSIRVVAILVVLAMVEGVSALLIHLVNRSIDEPIRTVRAIVRQQRDLLDDLLTGGKRHLMLDAALGWRYGPGWSTAFDRVNDDGLRGAREYALVPYDSVLRVAAFGDSFVYGNEVSHEDAWPAVAERVDGRLEILNYGVGGYGMDQAYLRYLDEGRRFAPDIVLIGFAPPDLGRLVNVYRRFLSSQDIPLTKPRFVETPAGLLLHPPPLRDPGGYARLRSDRGLLRLLGRNDYWYEPLVYANPLHDVSSTVRLGAALWIRASRRYLRPDRLMDGGVFRPGSEAFRLQVAVALAFADAVERNGAVPVVLFLPERPTVEARLDGRVASYDPLIDALESRGLIVIDATSAFHGARGGDGTVRHLFMPGGHYSPDGNALVAAWLVRTLRDNRAEWFRAREGDTAAAGAAEPPVTR